MPVKRKSAERSAVKTGEIMKHSREEWAEIIRAGMAKTIEAIIQTGSDLAEVKDEIGHGGWQSFLSDVGISQSTANRFMTIAANPVLRESVHWTDLPSSTRALNELARMPPAKLRREIKDGYITPDTTAKDAQKIRNPPASSPPAVENPYDKWAHISSLIVMLPDPQTMSEQLEKARVALFHSAKKGENPPESFRADLENALRVSLDWRSKMLDAITGTKNGAGEMADVLATAMREILPADQLPPGLPAPSDHDKNGDES